jgi:hypothetical protein
MYSPDTLLGNMPDTEDGTAPHTNIIAVADLNGDGLPDLLATRGQWRTHYLFTPAIFVNDGHGHFADRTSELFEGPVPKLMGPSSVLVADFNRDGRPDVFIGDAGSDLPTDAGYQDTLILSAPGDKLVDATANLPQQAMYTATASVADVNGDGAPDLFVGGEQWIGANEIQLNDGSGHFTIEPHGIPDDLADFATCHVVGSSAFADVDGNGTPDLIIGGGYNPCYPMPTGVLLNDGHGRFPTLTQQFPWPPFDFKTPMAIVAGDVNGDGAPDLVIAYAKQDFTGQWLQLLINDGHGHFSDETTTRLPPQHDNALGFIKWVRLIDLNGDGRLDIAASVQPRGAPWTTSSPYFLNDGTGHFTSLPPALVPGPFDTYTIGELGGGRGLDIAYGGDPDIWLTRTHPPTGQRLYATIDPQAQLSLLLDTGLPPRRIRPGLHQIVIWDRSRKDGLRLRGPGVNDATTRTYTGITTWYVALKPRRRYVLRSLANPSTRLTFTTRTR